MKHKKSKTEMQDKKHKLYFSFMVLMISMVLVLSACGNQNNANDEAKDSSKDTASINADISNQASDVEATNGDIESEESTMDSNNDTSTDDRALDTSATDEPATDDTTADDSQETQDDTVMFKGSLLKSVYALPDFTGDNVISVNLEALQDTDESNNPQKMIFKTAHDEMDIEDTWNDGISFKGVDLDPSDNYKDIIVTISGTDLSFEHLIIQYNENEIINYGHLYNYYPNLYYDEDGNLFYYGDYSQIDQLTHEFHYLSSNVTQIPAYTMTSESYTESSDDRSISIEYPRIEGLDDQNLTETLNEAIQKRALSIIDFYSDKQVYSGKLSIEMHYEPMMTDDKILSLLFYGVGDSESSPRPDKWEYTLNLNLATGQAIDLQQITDFDAWVDHLIDVSFTPIAGEEDSLHLTDDYSSDSIHALFADIDKAPAETTRYTYFTQEGITVIVPASSAVGGSAQYTMAYDAFYDYLKDSPMSDQLIDWQSYMSE